jgi:hypothetical protein
MNRRSLLSLIPAALLSTLLPCGVKALSQLPKKWYLGHNEPYDRSLVKFSQELGCSKSTLHWEQTPGEAPTCIIGMQQLEFFDAEQVHQSLRYYIDKKLGKII